MTSDETVEVSRRTLGRLYGGTKALIERDDQTVYTADVKALNEAEEVLDRA